MSIRRYTELDPRRELEQTVAQDLTLALQKRGATVFHHGNQSSHAPAAAPADITLSWKRGNKKYRVLVEVALRRNESEFTSIVSHLDTAITDKSQQTNLIYSGIATSARLARLIRNENQRRTDLKIPGRIVFIRLDDLQELLSHWVAQSQELFPAYHLLDLFTHWEEFTDDLNAFRIWQETIFPQWIDKQQEIQKDIEKSAIVRQERLRTDIIKLENQLREMGITGQLAHKMLIYLFFLALYEDRKGLDGRFSVEGFSEYQQRMNAVDRGDPEYRDRTAHYLFIKEIMGDPDIKKSGMMSQYEKIDLSDGFIKSKVLPIFDGYTFSDKSMDVIGAVFEALARRAEKDNRIGQFFTPETAVQSTCLLVKPRPTDLVADPACGTGRFLIHAMDIMLEQAELITDAAIEETERVIRQERLLGVDVDPWIATIAKMNMYIHGDGKSNIRHGNGLSLSTTSVFAPERSGTLSRAIDVVLTNPPLGDINFRELSLALARAGLLGDTENANITELAASWTNKYLAVVPHVCNEYVQEEHYKNKLKEWQQKEFDAKQINNDKELKKAQRYREQTEAKLREVQQKIGANDLTYTPSGSTAKGGVLFLSAVQDYLKPVRSVRDNIEWRGGAIGIVMDEAVLNTAEYQMAREFIFKHFFIKAIISLPRDAFAYVAKTTAKTSILYLVKKDDINVIQREPIFYAKAESIGYTNNGKPAQNDLKQINADFDTWKNLINSCYLPRQPFNTDTFAQKIHHLDGYRARYWTYFLNKNISGERLDFAYRRMVDEIQAMRSTTKLSMLVEQVIRHPKERPLYSFATVSRKDGRVRLKGEEPTSYTPSDLREIQEGDIILSGIDLVYGSIGVVDSSCDGMVVSKEYYILRVKNDLVDIILPEYITALLRTSKMRTIIEGLVTGTSNRTRIEDITTLLDMPIPKMPDTSSQKRVAETIHSAYMLQDEATDKLDSVQDTISNELWKS